MDESAVRANRYKFFAVGALGTFMSTFDGSIVNVALPTIAENLNCGVDVVAWVVLSYSLTLISLMLVFGAWTEAKGYAFAYRFGYIFFLGGSLVCSVATNIYVLILGRIIQATGTAMFAAIGPGMVARVFPANERGKGIGMMVMMVAAGFMVGPPVGGLMLGIWSWPSIFYVNLPVGIVGLYLVYRYFSLLPPSQANRKVRLPGAVAISAGLVSGILALSLVNDHPFSDPRIWGLLVVSGLALAAFFYIESKPDRALIGLEIFRNRQFTSSILAQSIYFVSSSGVLVLMPFYLERVRGFEPRQVGMFLIILPILMFVLAPLAGRLSDRMGYRLLTSGGMVLSAIGLFLFGQMGLETTSGYIVFSLVVLGVGVGTFSTPNSSALMGSVSKAQQAVASGILATNRNIGMSIGVGLSTAFYSFLEKRNAALVDPKLIFVTSFRPVIYVGAAVTLIGVVFCLIRGNGDNKAVDIDAPSA